MFDIKADENGRYSFKMPEYTDEYLEEKKVAIEARFEKAVAMREGGGSREYFTDFRDAVYSGGTMGLVILLSEVEVDGPIVIGGGGELTIVPGQGADVTVRRRAGNTGSIFDIQENSGVIVGFNTFG
jgi:hypothetical protein